MKIKEFTLASKNWWGARAPCLTLLPPMAVWYLKDHFEVITSSISITTSIILIINKSSIGMGGSDSKWPLDSDDIWQHCLAIYQHCLA